MVGNLRKIYPFFMHMDLSRLSRKFRFTSNLLNNKKIRVLKKSIHLSELAQDRQIWRNYYHYYYGLIDIGLKLELTSMSDSHAV